MSVGSLASQVRERERKRRREIVRESEREREMKWCCVPSLLGAQSAPRRSAFGPGQGYIWLDEVVCVGDEYFIQDCDHDQFGVNDCSHAEDASVVCNRT